MSTYTYVLIGFGLAIIVVGVILKKNQKQ